jgi:hypothetical protein
MKLSLDHVSGPGGPDILVAHTCNWPAGIHDESTSNESDSRLASQAPANSPGKFCGNSIENLAAGV